MNHKAQMYGDGESSGGIVPAKRSNEGLGRLQEMWREGCLAKENSNQSIPAPDSGPDEWANHGWAGARVGYRCTPLSKVGTVCVRSASTVLCGGCRATGIPTAP